jgi:MFS family permease
LLFISAVSYRLLSPDARRPLLIVMLAASVGSLAVIYMWSFTQRAFGKKAAVFSTWLVALFPEAVFLGASQMREPFLITALCLALAGYSRFRVGHIKPGSVFVISGFLLALIISPPYSLILLLIVSLAWVWEGKGKRDWIWIVGGILALSALVAIGLTLRAWSTIEGRPSGNVIQLLGWWLTSGAKYQLQLRTQESGWVTKMFGMVPEWSQMPLATAYGLVQPFLPAAVMDTTSAPLIRVLVSLRALGWFFLLPFLIASIFIAFRRGGWRSLPAYLVILVWVTAVLVSYRDAGRMWDNPRWRTIFLGMQAALAGWTWVTYRTNKNPWLSRIGIVVGFATLAFMFWNAGRYYHIPRLNLENTLKLIGGFTVLYSLGSWIYDRYRATKLEA